MLDFIGFIRTPWFAVTATIGSILAIDPAIDLSIDNQYTNMSAGQYNLQFDIYKTTRGVWMFLAEQVNLRWQFHR